MLKTSVFAILLFISSHAFAQSDAEFVKQFKSPRPHGSWILDEAQILSPTTEARLNESLNSLHASTGVELAIVTTAKTEDRTPKDMAVALFNEWGVGKEGVDNGLLIFHATDQRRIEIEVGYGLEQFITDARASKLLHEKAVPDFKKNDFDAGYLNLVESLKAEILDAKENGGGQAVDGSAESTRKSQLLSEGELRTVFFAGSLVLIVFLILDFILFFFIRDPYTYYKARNFLIPIGFVAGVLTVTFSKMFGRENPAFGLLTFGVLAGFFAWYEKWRRNRTRLTPRSCSKCGSAMNMLSREEEAAYLSSQQNAEETHASMQYDVWSCGCGNHRVDGYSGKKSMKKCTKCKARTLDSRGTRIVTPATTFSSGLGEEIFFCLHCQDAFVKRYTIPMKGLSSSGGSGGGGGGSFGGGRSGGGGAGASY